jgi:diacylglycerol kinase family enzyme
LGVLPAGTANLFAGALHLPTNPEDVARAVAAGNTRVIDTAMCNDLAFAVMAGTGLDAAMIEGAEDSKERLGTIAYVRAGVSEARNRKPFDVKVKVDGEVCFKGEATCVLIGNLGTLKGGMEAFPDAAPDDGLLDVAIVTATGLRQWGSLVWSTAMQRQSSSRHVQFAQGAQVKVKMPKSHDFELDGGTKGSAKVLDYRIVPSSLHVTIN